MSIELKHDDVTLLIHEPGELYRGSRFDWTGCIGALTFLDRPKCLGLTDPELARYQR
jgi:hypothetical protein